MSDKIKDKATRRRKLLIWKSNIIIICNKTHLKGRMFCRHWFPQTMQDTNTSKWVPIMIDKLKRRSNVRGYIVFFLKHLKKTLSFDLFLVAKKVLSGYLLRWITNLIFWKLSTFANEWLLFFFFFCGYLVLWNVWKFSKFTKGVRKRFSPKIQNIKWLKIP